MTSGFTLAVDVGGTKTAYGLISRDLKVKQSRVKRNEKPDLKYLAHRISSEVERYTSSFPIDCVAIDVPGIVDCNGKVAWAPNLAGSQDFDLSGYIEERNGIRSFVIDDRSAAVIGEHQSHRCENMVVIILGTGIGAGIIADGNILNLRRATAGSIGWNILSVRSGSNSRIGHLEELMSGQALDNALSTNLAKNDSKEDLISNHHSLSLHRNIFDFYNLKEKWAVDLVKRTISRLEVQMVNLVNLLMPELIILNGSLGLEIGGRFMSKIEKTVKLRCQPYASKNLVIKKSDLGANAFLIGSAAYALSLM